MSKIIAMLDYSEVNIEILDIGMKIAEFDNCKKVLKDDGDTNEVLATIQERARFSCKDG